MKRKDIETGWVVLLLLFPLFSSAANQYIKTSYVGTSTGTITQPWKTLSAVNQAALNPGDSVLFYRGEKYSQGQYTITRSGSSGAPIVFGAYGEGDDPILWGLGSSLNALFYMNNRAYITFDNLNITDTTISVSDRSIQSRIERAFYLDGTSNHIVIQNCRLDRVGVGAYFVGNDNIMQYNDIGNMRMVVNTVFVSPATQFDDYGANPVVIRGANNQILHNYFHDCWATSFDFGYDGGAVEMFGDGSSNNRIMYNVMYDCNGTMEVGSDNGGTSQNNIIAYNKLINNESVIYFQNSGPFIVNPVNFQIYNNVIIETVVGRLNNSRLIGSRSAMTTGTLKFKNNAVLTLTSIDVSASGANIENDHNVYNLGSGSVVGMTAGAGSVTTSSALFKSTAGSPLIWDYFPLTPLIDAGVGVGLSKDFAGNTVPAVPNAGILEDVIITIGNSFKTLNKFKNGN